MWPAKENEKAQGQRIKSDVKKIGNREIKKNSRLVIR